ncbi:ANR31 protein, partial [Upupa epops]|nr:ANR31 protein [Upupa epops]
TDLYIQGLSQMQYTWNEVLAKQKTKQNTLAKKCSTSVESFKKGAWRKQLANLVSKQNNPVTVAQNQEELIQKIQTYRKKNEMFSDSYSEREITNLVISHVNDKRQSLIADEIVCPDVVTFGMGHAANKPNGNRIEAHLSSENGSSAQEGSQYPHICLDEMGTSEAIRSKEVSDHALASNNNITEYPFSVSKLTNAVKVATLPSEPAFSTATTKCSQQKYADCVACVAVAEQGNKSLNSTSVTSALSAVKPQSHAVTNNVCQQGSESQQFLTDEDLHGYLNKTDDFQQQEQVVLSTLTKDFSNSLQQMSFQSNKNSFNASLVLANSVSNAHYPVNINQKSSQRFPSNEKCEKKQVRNRRRDKKKLQLIDLLELGRIKPGEDVLEFKLQEFSHKATVLKNGKVRTSNNEILQNPVQWIKNLLGSDISVTWKYVWNKVTYLGTPLSDFLVDQVSVSSDLELSQER